MIFRRIAGGAVALLLLPATAANACSLAADAYVPKDNWELVDKSDLVLIAKINGAKSGDTLAVTPISILRGEWSEDVKIWGEVVPPPLTVLSNPYRLADAEIESGSCGRSYFAAGSTVLFILNRSAGGGYFGPAFSRWAEDVPSVDAPWVKVVKAYLEASKITDAEARSNFLSDQRDSYAASHNPAERLVANELSRHIVGDTKWQERQSEIWKEFAFGVSDGQAFEVVEAVAEVSVSEDSADQSEVADE